MNWKLLLIISIVFLTACSSRQKVEDIEDCEPLIMYRTFDCGTPPDTDYVNLKPPAWVITNGLWTLTADEYANLGESVSTIIKAVKQQRAVNEFYEACIQSAQEQENAIR